MIRSFVSSFSRRNLPTVVFSRHNHKSNLNKKAFLSNLLDPAFLSFSTQKNIRFFFSSQSSHRNHSNHGHHHGEDPVLKMKRELESFSKQVQLKHPGKPEDVIKQLYTKCQVLIGQNKKVKILILFELIAEFIEAKNLLQKYSTFVIISANNSFQMGKYQDVQKRCKLALPFEIKKHGEVHKNIGDIYNMLGISVSKSEMGRGKEALQYLKKAFDIRNQIFGQSPQTAEVLFNTAIIEEESQKMFENAQKNYLDAIQIHQKSGIPSPLLYLKTKMRLAELQLKLHNTISKYISDLLRIQQSIQKFKSDQKFAKNEVSQVDMFSCLLQKNLGKKFMDSGDFQKAINYFQNCLIYLRENKMENHDRIFVLEHCGASYVYLNNFQKAAELIEEGDKILVNFPASEEYKFNYLRYLSQIYQKCQAFQKELQTLKRMKNFLKDNQKNISDVQKIYEVERSIIFCLGSLKKFDQMIVKGQEIIQFLKIEAGSFNKSKQNIPNYKSDIYAFIGFGYLEKENYDEALKYFEKSNSLFERKNSKTEQFDFHQDVQRRIALIYIKVKKDLKKGFQELKKFREQLLLDENVSDSKKLNELVILLLDYQVNPSENENMEEVMNKLIEADYIQNINNVLTEIIKVCEKVSTTTHCKQILQSYYFLIVSIHQMLLSFNETKSHPGKYQSISRTKQLLTEMIKIYDRIFWTEIDKVKAEYFKGDQVLKQFIQKVQNVKEDLKQMILTQ